MREMDIQAYRVVDLPNRYGVEEPVSEITSTNGQEAEYFGSGMATVEISRAVGRALVMPMRGNGDAITMTLDTKDVPVAKEFLRSMGFRNEKRQGGEVL